MFKPMQTYTGPRLLPLFVREQYVMSFLTMKKLSISRKITLFLYSIVVIHNGIGMVCIVIVDEKVSLASRWKIPQLRY